MSARKLIVIAIMVAICLPVLAKCPTQQTTVEFINGVNVLKKDAVASKDLLKKIFKETSGTNPECVLFDYSYNTNEPIFADFLEALMQKSEEKTGNFISGVKQFFGIEPKTDWFGNTIIEALFFPSNATIKMEEFFLGDQTAEHVAAYKKELAAERRVILAGHSQGSMMAVLERRSMAETEQANVFTTAIAAYSFPEPKEDKYTTLYRDNLALGLFSLFDAPPPNILSTEKDLSVCPDTFDEIGVATYFDCHSFDTTYLYFPETRNKITGDIASLLPTKPVSTKVFYEKPRVPPYWARYVNVPGEYIASRFVPQFTGEIKTISLFQWRYTENSGNVVIRIYSDMNGVRRNLLAESFVVSTGIFPLKDYNSCNYTCTEGEWIPYHFSVPVRFDQGKTYWISYEPISLEGVFFSVVGTAYGIDYDSNNECHITLGEYAGMCNTGVNGESLNMKIE